MSESQQVPIDGERYMSEEITNSLLRMALGPQAELPMCSFNLAATHGAGTGVAGLVAQAMAANISFFRDQIDVCCGEVAEEKDFTVEKLKEHFDIVLDLNAMLFLFTADRVSNPPRLENENVLTKAFAELPQEDMEDYNIRVLEVRGMLEDEILGEMMKVCGRIWKDRDEDRDWTEDIKTLLEHEVAPRLWVLWKRLGGILKVIYSMFVEGVQPDWARDVARLKGCPAFS